MEGRVEHQHHPEAPHQPLQPQMHTPHGQQQNEHSVIDKGCDGGNCNTCASVHVCGVRVYCVV